MVNFQDFTVTCNECGSKASIEGIQTEMDDIEED